VLPGPKPQEESLQDLFDTCGPARTSVEPVDIIGKRKKHHVTPLALLITSASYPSSSRL
jgi:hypothetical protein